MNRRLVAVGSRMFSALRYHNYRLYFVSQIVSFSGKWMQTIALSWLVLELTGSGTALGTVLAFQFLPMLLFGAFGGVLADRMEVRRLIMYAQAASGVIGLTLGVLTLTGSVRLWMVYVLAGALGVVSAVDNPSRHTFVMELVGTAEVTNAVTLNSVVVNAARVIGPAIGGVLIVVVGTGWCFVFNGVAYLAVIVVMALIRTHELHRSERAVRAPGQLREGFGYAWRTRELRTTLLMLVVIGMFTYEFTITLPLLSEFTFHAGATGLAMMTALMGAGAVVGGLVTASAGNPTARRLVMTSAAFGIIMLVVSAMPSILLVYVLMPLVGAASVTVVALSNTTLQLHSDPRLRGRVMALFSIAMIGTTPIGGPIVGAVAEHSNPRVAIALGGVAAIAAAMFGWSQLSERSLPLRSARGDLEPSVGPAANAGPGRPEPTLEGSRP